MENRGTVAVQNFFELALNGSIDAVFFKIGSYEKGKGKISIKLHKIILHDKFRK